MPSDVIKNFTGKSCSSFSFGPENILQHTKTSHKSDS